jgi:hypothetical protein
VLRFGNDQVLTLKKMVSGNWKCQFGKITKFNYEQLVEQLTSTIYFKTTTLRLWLEI